jgi:hypothetical protein
MEVGMVPMAQSYASCGAKLLTKMTNFKEPFEYQFG